MFLDSIRKFFRPSRANNYYPLIFRRVAIGFYTFILLLSNVVIISVFPDSGSVAASSITESTLIQYANNEREALGLGTLTKNAKLTSAAYAKAQNMFDEDYWAHYGPNGESPWQYIRGAGYTYIYAGENLAKGFSTSEGVHQAWMASPTHRANIVNSNFKEIGIAVATGTLQGEETILVVQMFGTPPASTPAPEPEPEPVEQEPQAQPEPDPVDEPVSEPEPAPEPAPAPQPVVEDQSGEILSIAINSVTSGDIYNEAGVRFEGDIDTVNSVVKGSYVVEIIDGETVIQEIESSELTWSATDDVDFEDGEYTIKAVVSQDGSTFEDSVQFRVDSAPPAFSEDSLNIEYLEDSQEWEVQFKVPEDAESVEVLIDSESVEVDLQEDSAKFKVTREAVLGGSDVIIRMLDENGNELSFLVEQEFERPTVSQVDPTPVSRDIIDAENGIFDSLASLSLRAKFNVAFAIVMFGLLGVQVYEYKKLKMLGFRGGYLMTIGVWSFLLLVGATVGAVGEVL